MAGTPSSISSAISDTADRVDPNESEELAQAREHITNAASEAARGKVDVARKELAAARDIITSEIADGDADQDQWDPLLEELQGHLEQLADMQPSKVMDAAIRSRARR